MMQSTRHKSLPMGEIGVARTSGLLRTLLGSCLGLALYDRRLKVAGLGHIVLPSALGRNEHPGKYADTAVPEMIRQMQELAGEERLKLCAKIAGGFADSDHRPTLRGRTGAADDAGHGDRHRHDRHRRRRNHDSVRELPPWPNESSLSTMP